MTEARASVDASLGGAVVAGFEALLAEPRREGLLNTELLHGERDWCIQTLWREQAALVAMRASTDGPAAPGLFRSLGAEPEPTVLRVRASTEP